MNYRYDEWLLNELYKIKQSHEDLKDFALEVVNEQLFAKKKTLTPQTIYIVVKMLASEITFNAQTTPIQIVVMSEQNGINGAISLLKEFAETHNFKIYPADADTRIKHQYSTPIILSNFNEITNGYRSVLYISGTLNIFTSVADLENLMIGSEEVTPISFNLAYTMQGNTQQKPTNNISNTIKSVSTQSITMVVPFVKDVDWLETVTKITSGSTDGNTSFEFSFTLNGVNFEGDYKLVSAQFGTAVNELPTLTLGFML